MTKLRASLISFIVLGLAVFALSSDLPPPARAGEVSSGPAFLEATFTPTVIGVSTAGTASYSLQIGRYSRVGNRVTVQISLTWTGGTGTGQFAIAGLPFASRNVASSDATCSAMYSSFTFGSVLPTPAIAANGSTITLWGSATAAGIAAVAYDAAASIWVTCSYEATPL